MRLSQITAELAGQPLPTTPTGDSLDERIAACFVNDAPPASPVIRKLIEEVKAANVTATEEMEVAKARSLDPSTSAADIAEARRMVDDAGWRQARTEIAGKRLAEVMERVQRAEAQAERDARVAEVVTRRDDMVAELRQRYPALVNDLADLLRRLATVDAEARANGVATAEDSARHGTIPANGHVTPLARCRLVDFERKYDAFIWADTAQNYRGGIASSLPAKAPSQEPSTGPTYVQVPTLRVEVRNETRGQRMWFANAVNSTVWVNPGCTETAVITEGDLDKVRENFTVAVLGPSDPVQRQTR